jgi:uridine phosphorylase
MFTFTVVRTRCYAVYFSYSTKHAIQIHIAIGDYIVKETAIIKCNCSHVYQDKQYGTGMRVHNPMKTPDKGRPQEYTCTVCGKTRLKQGSV